MTTQTKTQHTPGPWTATYQRGESDDYAVWAIMAQVSPSTHYTIAEGADSVFRLSPNPEEAKAEADANARLMAAAPDLLEACETATENITRALELGDKGDWANAEIWLNNARGDVQAALAKAKLSDA